MIVLGLDTATRQTSVALGSEQGVHASMILGAGRSHERVVLPAVDHLLLWSEIPLSQVGGVAVGIGPGLFTGLRVGVETAKALAQVMHTPIVGLPSLDVLAFAVRHVRRMICSVIDARRGELFFGLYRPVPAGVSRISEFMVGSPGKLIGELQATAEEVLLVGDGALRYRRELETLGAQVDFASPAFAHPRASAMIELSIPRFWREDYDRLFDVAPLYLRKSDAEIAWDKRARAG